MKIDLLGNRSLAVIRDTLIALEKQGIYINTQIFNPVDDEETIEMLKRGDSMGVFYIESPAMRQLQKKTLKGDFDSHCYSLLNHSSRAANRYISEYVKRVHTKKWTPIHPLVEEVLQETYGIMCYQEDVSKIAIVLAGFSEHDADQLRKVIAKNDKVKRLNFFEKQFRKGCSERNVSLRVQDEIWLMMLSFAGYSFCKPHSASYAMVSFQFSFSKGTLPCPFHGSCTIKSGRILP